MYAGSGVLIENGYIVTNAHVVWPFNNVGVIFPDGTTMANVPVDSIDLVGDLALLGPVSVNIPPITLVPREDLEIGSEVFLIGYPIETDAFPKPTITRGILSRVREWERIQFTYFQTDAAIAGGQSGGVLTTTHGEVVGISSMATAGENFAFVVSAKDIIGRLEKMISGIDVDGLDRKNLIYGESSTIHEFTLENIWATGVLIALSDSDADIDLKAQSELDVTMYVLNQYGDSVSSVNDHKEGKTEILQVKTQPGFSYVMVDSKTVKSGTVKLECNRPLALIYDPDDAKELYVGNSYNANIDFPLDFDWFLIELTDGQRITIEIESVAIDPIVYIDLPNASTAVEDLDSGGGIHGVNSRLIFRATTSGEHLIVVSDTSGYWTGGYIIDISEASTDVVARTFRSDEESPVATTIMPEPHIQEKIIDPVSVELWNKYFSFVPEGWIEDTQFFKQNMGFSDFILQFGGGRPSGFGYDPNVTVLAFPLPKNSASKQMIDQMINEMKDMFTGARIVSREVVTVDSVPGERIDMIVDIHQAPVRFTQIYLQVENQMWVLQCASSILNEESELCLDILKSFHIPVDAGIGVESFDTAMVSSGFYHRILDFYEAGEKKKAEEQLELYIQFAESLSEDDSGYVETVGSVGSLCSMLGNYTKAIDYLGRAVSALESSGRNYQLGMALNELAWTYYLSGQYAEGEPLGRRSVSIYTEVYGDEYPGTMGARHTMAMLLVGLEQYEEAEILLRKVLSFNDYENDLEKLAGYLTDLMTLLKRAGKYEEAQEIEERLSVIDIPPPDWATVDGKLPAEDR
jgi:hypothetical protein